MKVWLLFKLSPSQSWRILPQGRGMGHGRIARDWVSRCGVNYMDIAA
ncbi:MAG: hypothetical protein KF770_06100 [Anaerolineae bacterium]|nr:hypothetical protein [Anaerolineae bacterium]